ncbi:MAG: glycosyltransferase family 4 protein [Azospirillaceae bacterium]
MKLALGIVSLFGHGGLQRDCVAIARLLAGKGHDVTLFAARTEGPQLTDIDIRLLPVSAASNHGRNRAFADAFAAAARSFDRTVAFGILPGADVVYCADRSHIARHRHWWQRLTPRYRAMADLERGVFAPASRTRILALAQPQIDEFRAVHRTPQERLILLPPGIDPARRQPQNRQNGTRERLRAELGIAPHTPFLLWVGAQPRVKGLDRVLRALPHAPEAHLALLGIDRESDAAGKVRSWLERRGVRQRVHLLGIRDDVPELMAAADLLVHPARLDTTATVILEALANGLPVLASAVCGFAPHVTACGAGSVLAEPFSQAALDRALPAVLADPGRHAWPEAAARHAADPAFYRGREVAAAIIAGEDRRSAP